MGAPKKSWAMGGQGAQVNSLIKDPPIKLFSRLPCHTHGPALFRSPHLPPEAATALICAGMATSWLTGSTWCGGGKEPLES